MTIAPRDYFCPCGVSEPTYAVERAAAGAPQGRRLVFCELCGAAGTMIDDDADYVCAACAARLAPGRLVCITSAAHFGRHATILRLDAGAALVTWEEPYRGTMLPRTASIPLADLDAVQCLYCRKLTHPSWHCPKIAAERARLGVVVS